MPMNKLNRRTLQSENDDGKKKRNLFKRKGSDEGSSEDGESTATTVNTYGKADDSIPETHTMNSGPGSVAPSNIQGRSNHAHSSGPRKSYDELSMAIKVRNRTGSDEYPRKNRTDSDRSISGNPRSGDATAASGAAAVTGAGPRNEQSGSQDDWRGGTWGDSGYSATDEEAHRDVVYEPPNFLSQTMNVMFAQMKTFAKGRAIIILIGMIALIPILVFLIPDYIDTIAESFGATVSNAYTGLLLIFLPLIMALFTAKQCGTQIPNEFKNRTVYMSIPLPMSRLSFYFGKYLAGFLYCLALFLLAFGVAVACTSVKFDAFYNDILLEAIVGTVVAILVYSSTAFCIGCFMNRGSVLVPLFLNLIAFPCVFFYIGLKYDVSAALTMPVFLPDAVIQSLGFPISSSITGAYYATIFMGGTGYSMGSMWSMCALGLVWSACFLALGAFHMMRRET